MVLKARGVVLLQPGSPQLDSSGFCLMAEYCVLGYNEDPSSWCQLLEVVVAWRDSRRKSIQNLAGRKRRLREQHVTWAPHIVVGNAPLAHRLSSHRRRIELGRGMLRMRLSRVSLVQ